MILLVGDGNDCCSSGGSYKVAWGMVLGSPNGYNMMTTSSLDLTTILPDLNAITSERVGSNDKWDSLATEQQHPIDRFDKIS